jgi:hypothetical protein
MMVGKYSAGKLMKAADTNTKDAKMRKADWGSIIDKPICA